MPPLHRLVLKIHHNPPKDPSKGLDEPSPATENADIFGNKVGSRNITSSITLDGRKLSGVIRVGLSVDSHTLAPVVVLSIIPGSMEIEFDGEADVALVKEKIGNEVIRSLDGNLHIPNVKLPSVDELKANLKPLDAAFAAEARRQFVQAFPNLMENIPPDEAWQSSRQSNQGKEYKDNLNAMVGSVSAIIGPDGAVTPQGSTCTKVNADPPAPAEKQPE